MQNQNEKISRYCGRGPRVQGFYKEKTTLLNRLDPGYPAGRPSGMTTRSAFTLIELLVVVLIIGILAAVAVPQYQTAVLKSRTVQLQALTDSLRTAQRVYHLANGTYATKFEELDISIPPGATITTASGTDYEQATYPDGRRLHVMIKDGSNYMTSIYDMKRGITIHSGMDDGHKCQSYNESADKACLSLGGKYRGTACATNEDLAAGAHGCKIYSYR